MRAIELAVFRVIRRVRAKQALAPKRVRNRKRAA